ncbi:MAG: TetR/AcrR family transcriptional regulator [Bernardetiaceae bacterium]|nr:TetR/AcrR family transcriptional regulator [Bernardetiaceae bacterium]
MGVSERKAREKLRRKQNIIDAAEDVFFTQGFENSTMSQVALKAELSKGTLYLYFKSKDEIYSAIILRSFHILQQHLEQVLTDCAALSGFRMLEKVAEAYIKFAYEFPNYFNTILDYENSDFDLKNLEGEARRALEAGNGVIDLLVNAIRKGQEDGSIRPSLEATEMAFVLWSQLTGLLQVIRKKMDIISHYFSIQKDNLLQTHLEIMKKGIELLEWKSNESKDTIRPLRSDE